MSIIVVCWGPYAGDLLNMIIMNDFLKKAHAISYGDSFTLTGGRLL